jgi:hypothetical protein
MAELVLALGSSHSPMLGSPAEDYQVHAEIDRGKTAWKRSLADKEGNPRTFDELVAMADPGLAKQIEIEVLRERAARCQGSLDRLAGTLADAELDAVVVAMTRRNSSLKTTCRPFSFTGERPSSTKCCGCPRSRLTGGGVPGRNITKSQRP